ncbi:hypothetical protein BDW02DRAFT_254595 [Decorospora gaudefroyi]|uniref:Uncharacterized protein n=1 Tax=Decorospora gaudefroyi TaxID=184978 RepID=A0A6A5KG95_9PLEO|nr:hypothetical protein BDW02DRAFT_254595 [Decorospora gaudefroyi]
MMMTMRSKRSSSISSHRASRPPSLSYSNSRTNSEISMLGESETIVEGRTMGQPWMSQPWTTRASATPVDTEEPLSSSPQKRHGEPVHHQRSISIPSPTLTRRPTAKNTIAPMTPTPDSALPSKPSSKSCPCTCHPQTTARPTYTTASTQTSPTRTSLRINTSPTPTTHAYWPSQRAYPAPDPAPDYDTPPVFMGRMLNYFSKPGYQLGDSLFSGYQPINWDENAYAYEYRDEFGEEALR